MRKIILMLIIVMLNDAIISQWILQTSSFHRPVSKVYFINGLTGWASISGSYTFSTTGSFSRSSDSGNSWQVTIPQTCAGYEDFYFINEMTGWLVGSCGFDTYPYNIGEIRKTTNSGLSFIFQIVDTGGSFKSVFFLDFNTGWVTGKRGRVYKTTNGGVNWLMIQDSSSFVTYNKISFRNINTGYAINLNQILKTTSSGYNWFTTYNASGSNYINSVIFVNDTLGFSCGTNGLILKSVNSGTNWSVIQSPTARQLRSVYFLNVNTGYIAGGDGDPSMTQIILMTTNSGENWTINTSINSHYLNSIYFLNENTAWSGGGWTQGTYGIGVVYKTTNGGISGINTVSEIIPESFLLHQNYPNPFNPMTKLKFQMPKSGFTVLKVFDALGKEIQVLVNQQLSPGTYEVDFDGSNLPSGVYYYRLDASAPLRAIYTETKKMVLIK